MNDPRKPELRLAVIPTTGITELDQAMAEYADLVERHKAKTAETNALRATTADVRRQDIDAAAAAVRADRKDPGEKNLQALNATLDALEREREILGAAVNASAADLRTVVAAHAGELQQVYVDRLADARARLLATIDELEALAVEVLDYKHSLTVASNWPKRAPRRDGELLISGPGYGEVRAPIHHVIAQLRAIGEDATQVPWVDVVDAMKLAGLRPTKASHGKLFDQAVESGAILARSVPNPKSPGHQKMTEYETASVLKWRTDRNVERLKASTGQ